MQLKFVLLICLFVSGFSAKGQLARYLGYTDLICQYKLTWKFDTLKNTIRDDLIILQIGKNVSKSYSYYTFLSDSLQQTSNGKELWRMQFKKAIKEANGGLPTGFPYKRMKTYVYKDYKGVTTITDGISLQDFIYKDELNPQEWEILDSTKTVLDNVCQMAECTFRGRTWTAWFTPEIPVSDGPWKFGGLPGLILEVYDRGKQYHFIAKGIEKKEKPIVFSQSVSSSGKYEKTDRIEFLRTQKRFLMNSNGYMKMETGIDLGGNSSQKIMRYDLIERDY
ncbi:GLPGLI family protein [Geofilum sp. OHC36d9]|uniref:GLPGLI family protein n=1 Tax=Geofilum sp. OHC36d9 TaxID=3458413 RepID=UPI00403414FE